MPDLPDQQRRLAEQLTVFKDRLLDIDTRNPSLFLRRDVQERAFDLAKLGPEVLEGCYERLLRGSANIRLLSLASDSDPAVQMRGHLQKLHRAARAREEETGLRELYVGLCWITGHVEPRTFLRGPLLMVPARLELSQAKRDAGWQLSLEPEELVINAAILAAIRKHRSIRLPDSLRDDFLTELENLRGQPADERAPHAVLHACVARICAAGGLVLEPAIALVQPLLALTKSTLPAGTQPLRFSAEVVVGLFPQSSTALYADLETMIERAATGEGDMGVVDNLLEVPADKTEGTGDQDGGETRAGGDLPEGSVHCVIPTDPSQHRVVKMAQDADVLVVRGPPGTGKSQTIVNLVSDAMARQKRVLVVCQKRAALDVVYRRLRDVGLAGSAALVHDATADRPDLYKQLQAQLQGSPETTAAAGTRSAAIAVEVDERTRRIRALVDPLGSAVHGLPLHDVYALATSGFKPCLDLPGELVRADFATVQRVCAALENAKHGHLRFDDASHPLALRQNWSTLGHVDCARMSDALRALAHEARQGGTAAALPDPQRGMTLATHVESYLLLRSRWFRGLLPRWWRAKRAVAHAIGWFGGAAVEQWRSLIDRHATLAGHMQVFAAAMQARWQEVHGAALGNLPALAAVAESAQHALDVDLDGIRAYDRVRAELAPHETALLEKCAGRLRAEVDWAEHVRQEVLLRWIDEAEAKYPRLRDRIAIEHTSLRTEIEAQMSERRGAVAGELATQLRKQALTPSFDPREQNHPNRKPATDWNKLAHEVGKKRRVKPLRSLVSEFAWPVTQQIRCWLASPEVVAEVFPLERDHFDVVIFDEASQLTLERALPVIYRARQVIIAGDEQQMPPSNFFGATVEEDDEAAESHDKGEARFAESLLAQAKRVYGFRYLAWHYRSAFQQLIEFSNHAFYDGALQVAANRDCGATEAPIAWIPVAGVWIDQTNPIEARRTVDEIKSLLEEHRQKPRSLGVITFNQKQQVAILDEIENRRSTDPEFEALWSRADNPESGSLDDRPFVKNIENVQGDERDYILFSVAYAPGPDGVLRRNFGPLGLSGGENRLNVAITRAKRGIRVICSFDPETLAVETSKNRGPLLLKQYLQYARAVSAGDQVRIHGVLEDLHAEQRAPQSIGGSPRFDSTLEEQVYGALTRQGLQVYAQWGAGSYRIDLVVVDPSDPNRLCLGIECDGAAYHSGQSVRERDIARQAFLEARGWRIHRIWSRDWWKDQPGEIARVMALVAEGRTQAAE